MLGNPLIMIAIGIGAIILGLIVGYSMRKSMAEKKTGRAENIAKTLFPIIPSQIKIQYLQFLQHLPSK